jgi:hypothetical protein
MRRTAVAACLAATLLAAGCSKQDTAPPPKIDDASSTPAPSGSATASASPSASAAAPTTARPPVYGERVANRATVTVGKLPSGREQRVVAEALVAYARARLTSFHDARVDLNAVAAVASGDALQQIQSYVAGLRQRKQHTDGGLAIDVNQVAVTGKLAQVGSCMRNTTADANSSNQVVERDVSPAYRVKATATEVAAGRWLISRISFVFVPSCA